MIRALWLLILLALSSTLPAGGMPPGPAGAQERPRYGGELIFLVPSEPPSYDGHREGTTSKIRQFDFGDCGIHAHRHFTQHLFSSWG